MRELNLGLNRFGDAGAIQLATCVQHVQSLLLQKCNITATGVKALAQSIRVRDGQVWLEFHDGCCRESVDKYHDVFDKL